MSFKNLFLATVLAFSLAVPACADGIMVEDAYARSTGKAASSGAAFMVLMNHTDADDRLIGLQSDAAQKVQLHTHSEDANGVMKMRHLVEGVLVPAGGMHALERGGDHVMFMGLFAPMTQGDMIAVTLLFDTAGEIEVIVPVDLNRKPKKHKMKH
ncbi:MAG: copper chaperone PCu(A)C [Paracoccaceae bacterium]|jgi:periplasmic copper chaperone A|nr:copper chaperone PCu(A)C [Paracoccaceae bacterium]